MKKVHIYRKVEGTWYHPGDAALCGFTGLIGREEADRGEWLGMYFQDGLTVRDGETWCPGCEDAVDPLEQLASTEL